MHFEHCNPILRVEDMATALAFYVNQLGFVNAPWGDADFTSISRDKASLYLCRSGQGRGQAWIWIGVDDAQRLYEEYRALGIKILMPPTNFPWALETHVEDLDGNVIRFGSEPI